VSTPATKPSYSAANDTQFGPARIEHRTADSGLQELGTYFMVFDSDEHSDPWTLQYEETAFVIEGEARFIVIAEGGVQQLVAASNELLVLPEGTTVRYGATAGTRLLLSISPVNWRTSS
jgi:ethanolamine utilization protein EutQ (cupin superfamily)